jgi:large subunit ribosomal protein L4
MKTELLNLQKEKVGEIDLNPSIFGLEVRIDIINTNVVWQRLKAMSGTHSTKTVSDVSGTTKKPFRQKGTGNARQGSLRSAQMRGGGVSHGPVVRSHEVKLPKKVRRLGLKHALSMKMELGSIFIVDSMEMSAPKTSELVKSLAKFGSGKFFLIGGESIDPNFKLSTKSIVNTNVVPTVGANVYDVINSDFILIAKDALPLLEERLK